MMGSHDSQKDLFSYHIDLDKRVRADNPLRQIAEQVDFTFVREAVKDCYGYNGNESVPPETVLKMMFLLFFENVSSERALMRMIPERLDYMWFLGYGLNDEVPHHSVLSKARKKWGPKVFEEFFIRVVWQCAQAGLVDGKKIFVDGSLVDANASKNSVLKGPPELIEGLKRAYGVEEAKLEALREGNLGNPYYEAVNKGVMSTTDPEAPVVKQGKGKESRPRYKNHRVVDDATGVITATETTPGDVEENEMLMGLIEGHEAATECSVETVVADCQYGTNENFRSCQERGIRSHMGDFRHSQMGKGRRAGIFGEGDFIYDAASDTYVCPAGERLRRRKHKTKRKAYEYAVPGRVCASCLLREQCTRAKHGAARTIKRHYNQEGIDAARAQSHSQQARRDRVKRKWFMEGSFGDAALKHGFKRARWRRLWRQQIQDHLIATVQNIRIMIRHAKPVGTPAAQEMSHFGVIEVVFGVMGDRTSQSKDCMRITRYAGATTFLMS